MTGEEVAAALEHPRRYLADTVDPDPAVVAEMRQRLVVLERHAREARLSDEIRADALEMLRRAEYALGKAIRRGQERGTIGTRGHGRWWDHERDGPQRSPADYATRKDLGGATGIYAMADVEPDRFEAALADARAEGNLTRAGVIRKLGPMPARTEPRPAGPETRAGRAELIRDLAGQGYSSRQMPGRVGVTEGTVRLIARDYGVDIPADRTTARTHRIDPHKVIENTATALETLISGVELVDPAAVDPATAQKWADSLTASARALNRFARQIKEQAQ